MFTIKASDYCGPPNPRTLSWNKSTDCCSWDRVQCDETTGQVIEPDLTCSGLQGKFHSNSSLFQLSSAQLRGILPERVFHLSNLEYLYLSSNSLTGPIPSNRTYSFNRLQSESTGSARLGKKSFERNNPTMFG
ncbi:hypothetical protein BC332_34699 [Capsicum chinense]|nr:hypothetical protein BC332_34699 [Capsicum chinense]